MTTKGGICPWCGDDPLYVRYHNEEWGKECHDDKIIFEFIILESAQAGLSWITVLRKREAYKKAFDNFDVKKVAKFDEEKISELTQNVGIIRNEAKIRAAINNAKIFIAVQEEFGSFAKFMYSFMPKQQAIMNFPKSMSDVASTSKESDAISKELKRRGFKFFGSTICYAHMQATGMVNDHLVGCPSK